MGLFCGFFFKVWWTSFMRRALSVICNLRYSDLKVLPFQLLFCYWLPSPSSITDQYNPRFPLTWFSYVAGFRSPRTLTLYWQMRWVWVRLSSLSRFCTPCGRRGISRGLSSSPRPYLPCLTGRESLSCGPLRCMLWRIVAVMRIGGLSEKQSSVIE